MPEWWNGLSGLNQAFYLAAAFFSVFFLWQMIAALIGLAGGEGDLDADLDADVDMDVDADFDADGLEAHSAEAASDSLMGMKLLSVRAVLAFCTLFSWAGALYLPYTRLNTTLLYALGWGLAGWVLVVGLVALLRRLAETGTGRLATCVGTAGTVYMNIPAGGQGQVRVRVSGAISMVKARAAGDTDFKAGTAVRVLRMLDHSTVEVGPAAPKEKEREGEG